MMNFSSKSRNNGAVLAVTLILLLTLTMVAVTVAYRNTIDELMAANQRDAILAMAIAETGITAARPHLKKLLLNESNVLSMLASDANMNSVDGVDLTDVAYSGGYYTATVSHIDCVEGEETEDATGIYDSGDFLVVSSTGTKTGAERVVEVIYSYSASTSQHAILTQDDLVITGNSAVQGAYAFVHSNSDIYLPGSPAVDQSVSASGDIFLEGNPDLLGDPDVLPSAANVAIPEIDPTQFRDNATIIFTFDCVVLDGITGATLATLANINQKYHGWTCNSSNNTWKLSSANGSGGPLSAFYYVEGNVILGASAASVNTNLYPPTCVAEDSTVYCMKISVVAEGSIFVQGALEMQPFDLGILFMAGNDLKVQGSTGQQLDGLLAAHQEIYLAGHMNIEGSVIAENGLWGAGQQTTTDRVIWNLTDNNVLTGSGVVTKNSISDLPFSEMIQAAWRELVD